MPAYSVPVEVRFNDIDGMGHVNNALFLTYLEHCRMRCEAACYGTTRAHSKATLLEVAKRKAKIWQMAGYQMLLVTPAQR